MLTNVVITSLAPAPVPQMYAAASAAPHPALSHTFQLASPPNFVYNQASYSPAIRFYPPVRAPTFGSNMLSGVNVAAQPTQPLNMVFANLIVGNNAYNLVDGGYNHGTAAAGAGAVPVLPFPGQQNPINIANNSLYAPPKPPRHRKREGEKNTKTAEQLRALAQRSKARQATGLSNPTATAPEISASVIQALVPAGTYETFHCFEQLPLELQIMIWQYFLADWCSDPSNGRIIEVWLARQDPKTADATRNPYKFLSPTNLPFVFSLCNTLAREADDFFDKMFITSYDNKEDNCIRVLPGIDTVKLSAVRGIGAGQSPACNVLDALVGLNKYEPETVAAIKNIAVPVPYNGSEIHAWQLAAGLKLCGGLKKVVLLTEHLPCTPGSLAVAKRKVPDGNLALGPPRFNSRAYTAWNVIKDVNLVRRKLREVTTEQRIQAIEIVAHNLISGAEQWGAELSSTQVYVPKLASKTSAQAPSL